LKGLVVACLGVALLAAFACGRNEASESTLSVTDSAGVRIVAYDGNLLPDVPEWSVAEHPFVDIGGADAEGAYALFHVCGVSRRSTGDLVIANAGSHEIRVFDSTGTHRATVGRMGEGPGEFVILTTARAVAGDSIVAFDGRLGRVTVFDPDLGIARTFRVGAIGYVLDVFPDGSLLASRPELDDLHPGVLRPWMTLIYVSTTGARGDTIGRFSGDELFYKEANQYVENWAFGKRLVTAVADTLAYVGTGDTFQLEGFGRDGTLRLIVRVASPAERVTDEAFDRLMAQRLDVSGDPVHQEGLRRLRQEAQYPETMPPYDSLLVDPEGDLWVREFHPWLTPDSVYRWHVLSAEGVPVAKVELPGAFSLMAIDLDWVAGVWRDEMGVEEVRMYRLRRR